MSRVFPITSTSNPRIKRLLKLRKHRDRRDEGVFIAEGLREVERAAAAGLMIEELYECPDRLGGVTVKAGAAQRFLITPAILEKAAYRDDPEGVLAVVKTPVWSLSDLDAMVRGTCGDERVGSAKPQASDGSGTFKGDCRDHTSGDSGGGLFLVAVGTEKPGNLGAMVRTAGAAGCVAVLATGPVDAFNPNAIRASTGAVFHVPVVEATEEAIIAWCARHGISLMASTPPPKAPESPAPETAGTSASRASISNDLKGGIAYTAMDFRGPCAIVIGPEDRGLDERWMAAATSRVTIPMRTESVDSLNAGAAAAVLLFEAARQRSGVAAGGDRA